MISQKLHHGGNLTRTCISAQNQLYFHHLSCLSEDPTSLIAHLASSLAIFIGELVWAVHDIESSDAHDQRTLLEFASLGFIFNSIKKERVKVREWYDAFYSQKPTAS
jgi:hypothetical protein